MPRMRQASASPAIHAVVARAGVEEHEAAEDGGVADPVERRVEVGAPLARAARLARHDAVDVSEKTKAVMTRHADPDLPAREEGERADADPDGADDGHDVGADAQPEEEVGDRTEDLGHRRAQESVEHGGTSVLTGGRARAHRTQRGASVTGASRPGTAQPCGQAATRRARVSSRSTGSALVWRDDRQEVRVAAPARHDVLVQVGRDAGTGDGPLVHAEVEAVRLRRRLQHADHLLRQRGELGRLLVGEVDVEGDVAVGADEDVPRVVREEVHHDVAVLAAVDDEALLVGLASAPRRTGSRGPPRRSACHRGCRPSGAASTAARSRPRRGRSPPPTRCHCPASSW